MRTVSCNLCGSDKRRLLVTGRDRDNPTNERLYSLYACAECGLVYLSPRPDTPEELAEIYPATYDSFMPAGDGLLMRMRRLAWRPEITEILALTAPGGQILEVGSATGEFLAELRRHGRANLVGLELSAAAAGIARERHGLDVRAGELHASTLPEASVELVVMRHVFEHTPDPRATLATIAHLLRPGGRCVITIPNIDSHTARIFGADWYGYQLPRHFHLFPQGALVRMLRGAGLSLERVVHVATPNIWIGSLRFWLAARRQAALAQFFRYQNPLALAACAPLGLVSSVLRSSGTIRAIVQRPI